MGNNHRKTVTTIDAIGEDVLLNILNRLSALHFASAACVSRSWRRLCDSILSTPKLASALSFNPSYLDAVEEVCNKVFSEPIRPHFAIVSVGISYTLDDALPVLVKKLGSTIPIICTFSNGVMGRDAATDSFIEIPRWRVGEGVRNPAVLLTVGFLPGMKVAAVTMSQPDEGDPYAYEFVRKIRQCSTSASGVTSPAAIMLFTYYGSYMDSVLEKLDCFMSPETVIVGEGGCFFLCGGNCVPSKKNFNDSIPGVALLFMRDQDRPHGNIQFHAALSAGLSPIGPVYKTVAARDVGCVSYIMARREGYDEVLGGQSMLHQIHQMQDHTKGRFTCLGVVKRGECFLEETKIKSQVFHPIYRGDEGWLCVGGRGIKSSDHFRVFQSDSHTALSSLEAVNEKFRSLKQRSSGVGSSSGYTRTLGNGSIIFGGIIFSNRGGADTISGKSEYSNVESRPFLENFPGVPLAGSYGCKFPLCRGDSSSYDGVSASYRCFVHAQSSVYLVMSYTPSGHVM